MARSVYEAAVGFLSRREHSRRELTQKLSRRYKANEITTTLDQLTASGLLNEGRFIEAYMRTAGSKFGRQKLQRELQLRGIEESACSKALSALEAEPVRAMLVLRAKYGDNLGDDIKKRAAAWRFLHSRGFTGEDIARAMEQYTREQE